MTITLVCDIISRNSEKAMKRNSKYTINFREKMAGVNLHFSISKQSRSFEPNGQDPSRLQRIPALQGHDMLVSYESAEIFSEFRW